MKLTEDLDRKADQIWRSARQLKEQFAGFYERTDWLRAAECPVRGVVFSPALDDDYFDVSFVGVRLRFHFAVRRNASGVAFGLVTVTREHPRFTERPVIVGSFTFGVNGATNFDPNEDGSRDVQFAGNEIVLHYLLAALELPCE